MSACSRPVWRTRSCSRGIVSASRSKITPRASHFLTRPGDRRVRCLERRSPGGRQTDEFRGADGSCIEESNLDGGMEMTEHAVGGGERRAAHQRLATGGLARWARACATHPWRVVLAWLGILAALIVLVVTVGGALKDVFEIPGSDTQKA